MSGSIAALFQCLTQGIYVVGVANGEMRDAFTAAWVMQVSFDPLLLALSISPRHSSYGLLKEGRAFSISAGFNSCLSAAAAYDGNVWENTLIGARINTTNAIDRIVDETINASLSIFCRRLVQPMSGCPHKS